jgi:hypothetical protein
VPVQLCSTLYWCYKIDGDGGRGLDCVIEWDNIGVPHADVLGRGSSFGLGDWVLGMLEKRDGLSFSCSGARRLVCFRARGGVR